MIANIFDADELRGYARRARKAHEYKSVRHALVAEEEAEGWQVEKKNRSSTRLSRLKPHDRRLEDRVWTLFFRMGFTHLSGEGGGRITPTADGTGPHNQLDVVAVDDEVAIVAECKSSEGPRKISNFPDSIAKVVGTRDQFIKDLRRQLSSAQKRNTKYCYFLSNLQLGDSDITRAEQQGVIVFEESDLAYYEALTEQIGQAARFQFLADLMPGRSIPGLELTVPSVRTKMGGYRCYTFSVSPEYLLKVAYVSHRAKGKPSDVDTYQRMVKKSRLLNIREYIQADGIFPTNIVVNLKKSAFDFQRAKQEDSDHGDSTFGWLKLSPSYKSAWIIDGQHRMFAYAGHPMARKGVVSVLAFEDLPPGEQARLFIDINAEQKKVKQSLLQELYAELHWDSDDPEERVRAILSKAIQALDTGLESPLRGRILKADERRTDVRCVTLTAVFNALGKPGFFIEKLSKGQVAQYGPLWAGTLEATLKRTVTVTSSWFSGIRTTATTRWDLGQVKGGGLAMNDGITVCINLLRSVLEHFQARGMKPGGMTDSELAKELSPFALATGQYFGQLADTEMDRFRQLRGVQGQTTGTRRLQQHLHAHFESFNPTGLDQFVEAEKSHSNQRAYELISQIENLIQRTVIDELKREYRESEDAWWFSGVPVAVRKKVSERIEEAQGKEGGKEQNFDLIDYRAVITHQGNWHLFKDVLGEDGGKEKGTKWIVDLNEIRRMVMHASKGLHMPVTPEQIASLEGRLEWISGKATEGQSSSA